MMTPRFTSTLLATVLTTVFGASHAATGSALDRTVLPIAEPARPTYTELDARTAKAPPRFDITAPKGAPNVIVILLDDVGFATSGTFGGPVDMPTLDKLAQHGLSFNRFHTTALSSPTRMALKTGRNHHTAETGSIMETATSFPGNTGRVPNSVAPVAEMLRLNGFSTAAFGKWHETASWEGSVSGPFDRWPTRQGFDKFYGFIGGETNHWAPTLVDGTSPVELPADPNYYFTTDMTNRAITWMKQQQALTPDKPFFMYYAPGAAHAPHHAPKEWIDRWKGKFDQGWDVLREETLKRQIAKGIVPPGTKLAPKPAAIKDWDTLNDDEKRLFTRQAEVYAGFLEMTDHEVGRLVDAVTEIGELDNTMIVYIVGDNGASAEGGMNGMYSEMTYFNGVTEKVEDMVKLVDKWGGPETYPHMAAGWAVAFDTPYTWTKQVASNYGGTRNAMVMHWPNGIKAKGEIRSQFTHVTDVAPTILEAAKLPEPKVVNGVKQIPMEGKSMMYSFDNDKAKERHTTQYFEIFGNRAIYHNGWLAGTVHKAPWEAKPRATLAADQWELYDERSDFSLSNDLAKKNPKKLAELQSLFMKEAQKYHVLPIDDRSVERVNPKLAGRPDLMGDRTSITLSEGMVFMTENTFPNVKNRSITIDAEIVVPDAGAQGAIIVQGGRFGGWAMYANQGKVGYSYNFLGLEQTAIESPEALSPGKHTVRLEFNYAGGGLGKGGKAILFVDGSKVAEGDIPRTHPIIFSAEETADVGIDLATPVVEAVGSEAKSRFNGKIPKVTLQLR
ncbi:arylsulfatase [Chitinilyticum aquatile]|uniref:arylsulfatase n=1 Tax=Chitinilyticum aquatile TaxID=362520 RepID=UPI000424A4F5|nr:arylsulfatase [Chitinilyticum aquatile]